MTRVLAGHVVGGGEDVADRGPPQGDGPAGGVGDPVGEVGTPPGDEVEGEGWLGARHVGGQPVRDGPAVDALDVVPGR